jgi:hypothetical protein
LNLIVRSPFLTYAWLDNERYETEEEVLSSYLIYFLFLVTEGLNRVDDDISMLSIIRGLPEMLCLDTFLERIFDEEGVLDSFLIDWDLLFGFLELASLTNDLLILLKLLSLPTLRSMPLERTLVLLSLTFLLTLLFLNLGVYFGMEFFFFFGLFTLFTD